MRFQCGEPTSCTPIAPFFGFRRIAFELKAHRKGVQRLMWAMGLEALGPKPSTSNPAPGHKVYPYLLRNLAIGRSNQEWATDTPMCASVAAISISSPSWIGPRARCFRSGCRTRWGRLT